MTPTLLTILAIVIFGSLVVIVKLKAKLDAQDEASEPEAKAVDVAGYQKKRYLFSSAEYSFYKVLVMAVGQRSTILTKIRLADIIEVQKGTLNWQSKFNRIAKKHADFVLCDPKTMVVQIVIELDDASHGSESRQERDAFVDAVYGASGIPVLHVPAAREYAVADVSRQVERLLA